LAALLVAGLAGMTVLALTAGNIVAASKAEDVSRAVNVNEMKDPACNALALTSVIVGNTGNAQANLLLGSAAGTTMNGQGQSDCVMGGGGNDALRGGGGIDVCIGGPGVDTFNATCETQIP
jgi:Ca2+-binding RTX toxin-like protein